MDTAREGEPGHGCCALCGGRLLQGIADIPFPGTPLVLVREVPARVCGDCGEAYLQGPMVDRLLSIVRELQQLQAEVSVVRYKEA